METAVYSASNVGQPEPATLKNKTNTFLALAI